MPTRTYATIADSVREAKDNVRRAQAVRLLDEAELERFKNLIIFAKTTV